MGTLRMLPDLVFPITPASINPLMDNVMKLNQVDAGIPERVQRALTLFFHVSDLYVKSHGRLDYRGEEGRQRLVQDAVSFIGGSTIATKIGDLPAAHLSIDFSDAQCRLAEHGLPLLPSDVNQLIELSRKMADYPPQTEQRVALFLDYISKRPIPHGLA